MVDPYDFVASPSAIKSKQTRRKSIRKISKKRKSNEKPQRVSIRQMNNKSNVRTQSNTRDTDHLIHMYEKENNPNNGFTQLIQTKMMEVKKRQGNRKNKKVNIITDDNHSPLVMGKRQRSDNEDSPDVIPTSSEKEIQGNNPPSSTIDEHVNPGTTCRPRCESKDHHIVPANKRRRACLCSKRQLDELEFAPDSVPSQTQQQQQQQQREEEQQPLQEESHLEPVLPSVNHSPPPLLLPCSPVMRPSTLIFALPPIPSVSIIQQQQEEEEERENQLNVPSIIAAPLSPAMPLNSTYIAHRTIPITTQLPSTLLDLSTLIPPNITTILPNDMSSRLTSSIIPSISNNEQQKSDHSLLLAPIESTTHQQDQETSMTLPAVQTIQCSVSTQTSDDYYPIHHHCNDVSVCPCVQIYTRSEQLFMASMAIFFRNSITITSPVESSLTTVHNTIKKNNNKKQQINHQNRSPQLTPVINEIQNSIQIEKHTEINNNVGINETYVINTNNNDIIPSTAPVLQQSSSVLVDTSTVINETRHDNNSKKSDGSSIQININSKEELNKITDEENFLSKSSDDRNKFKSLVLTITALKDEQKIVFNRFIEYFSVRSSTLIDDTTTHLITDEDNENSLICPLTGKVLQAVARHLTIVSYRWLTACLTEQRYVNEIPLYEIIGDTIYNQHNGMSRSRLNNSNNYRLLANYAFHLKCPSCQPFIDNRPLIELIHLSGGLILKTLNQHIDNIGRQIIILCSKNYLQNKPALEQACQKLNILCIEPEWIIASIVKFDIQPYEPWLCTLFS